MTKLKILLVDDHSIVREGLKSLIESSPQMKVVGEAADAVAAMKQRDELRPDVMVVDISLPGMNGIRLTETLKAQDPNLKVLALTVHESSAYLRSMLEAGASGYVLKRTAAKELLQAIQVVARGGQYLDPAVAEADPGAFNRGGEYKPAAGAAVELSERETEVVRDIARGFSNKEIAKRLGVSVKTVETYKLRSLEKLGLHSRVDIVRYAMQQGWL